MSKLYIYLGNLLKKTIMKLLTESEAAAANELISMSHRNHIYKRALLNFKLGNHMGLCDALRLQLNLTFNKYFSTYDIMMYLPEFKKQKPEGKDFYNFWWEFNDNESREQALINCITETI